MEKQRCYWWIIYASSSFTLCGGAIAYNVCYLRLWLGGDTFHCGTLQNMEDEQRETGKEAEIRVSLGSLCSIKAGISWPGQELRALPSLPQLPQDAIHFSSGYCSSIALLQRQSEINSSTLLDTEQFTPICTHIFYTNETIIDVILIILSFRKKKKNKQKNTPKQNKKLKQKRQQKFQQHGRNKKTNMKRTTNAQNTRKKHTTQKQIKGNKNKRHQKDRT